MTYIKPLTNKMKSPLIVAWDLETMLVEDKHVPIAVSSTSTAVPNYFDETITKPENTVASILTTFFDVNFTPKALVDEAKAKKESTQKPLNVVAYAHNFGGFDGYLIYTTLVAHYGHANVKPLIDNDHSFVMVKIKTKKWGKTWNISLYDSNRIFSQSLKALCKAFNVDQSKLTYEEGLFNEPELLRRDPEAFKRFKEYSIADAVSLHQCIKAALNLYQNRYYYDLTKSPSIGSIAMGIFRTRYLEKDTIAVLPTSHDREIRPAYYGGHTQAYKVRGNNLHYYDVNSLYPAAILNPMPVTAKGNRFYIENLKGRPLDEFFGFAYARIVAPKSLTVPFLPIRVSTQNLNETLIWPTGSWRGIYFSEELKFAKTLGYDITLETGYEFSKGQPFEKYINQTYEAKKTAVGGQRVLVKGLLNYLYGYFGRAVSPSVATIIPAEEVIKFLKTYHVLHEIDHGDGLYTILSQGEIRKDVIDVTLGKDTRSPIIPTSSTFLTSTNVAIAAAVTAYARIHIYPYKTIPGNEVFYTDTDSVVLQHPLPSHLVSKDQLGLMKDELDGGVMKEAIFLGEKKYGYTVEKDGITTTHSVFAGYKRDGLNIHQLEAILKGEVVKVDRLDNFVKNASDITIRSRLIPLELRASQTKKAVGNTYVIPHVTQLNPLERLPYTIQSVIRRIKKVTTRLARFIEAPQANPPSKPS